MKPGSLYDMARELEAPMPYSDFSDLQIVAIEAGLRLAWGEAIAKQAAHGVSFASATEEEISVVLFSVLGTLASQPGGPLEGLLGHFQMPIPESTLPSHITPTPAQLPLASTRGKGRPDFAFRPWDSPPGYNPAYFAFFVEAKLIERSKPMSLYAGLGLTRYVTGAYASSMSQGMMLGYMRTTGQHLPQHLQKHFDRLGNAQAYGYPNPVKACTFSLSWMRMHESTHGRTGYYIRTLAPAGPIRIFHLWLQIT